MAKYTMTALVESLLETRVTGIVCQQGTRCSVVLLFAGMDLASGSASVLAINAV